MNLSNTSLIEFLIGTVVLGLGVGWAYNIFVSKKRKKNDG